MMKYAYMGTPPSDGGVTIHIPTVVVTEHADLYGPPGSKRIVAMCGASYGMQHWTAAEARMRAKHTAVRLAVLHWLSTLEDQCPLT